MARCSVLFACLWVLALGPAGCDRGPAVAPARSAAASSTAISAEFLALMNAGRNAMEQGDATHALITYRKAAVLVPQDVDVHLNLANAHLRVGAGEEAIREVREVLRIAPNTAAAYFVLGSAHLRLGRADEAVKAFENVRTLDQGDTATHFQLGRAHMELKQWDAAIAAFKEGLALDPNRLHAAAHYLLAQSYLRAGRQAEGLRELGQHQAGVDAGGNPGSFDQFERSQYTQARVPFVLEQPEPEGVTVRFVDATSGALAAAANGFTGPVGVIDPNHSGWDSLFALGKGGGFRLLVNSNGTFHPAATGLPSIPGARYASMLVGDLQNDRFEDVVVLGDRGSHLFRFGTNAQVVDVSRTSHLDEVRASEGALMDLDFTGKLDLLIAGEGTRGPRLLRQSGPLVFGDVTATSGVPDALVDARSVFIEDWNRDGNTDVIVSRKEGPPMLLEKQRGAGLVPRPQPSWVAGAVTCTGDFDNDLGPDLAVVGPGRITICFNGGARREIPVSGDIDARRIVAVDHDNDGWLDLWVVGGRIRVWRNLGLAGFEEVTAALGLDRFDGGAVASIHFADFDRDCDSDALVVLAGGGLRYLRNDGGNANGQVRVQLFGNRSNASGLGCKIEIETGGLRLQRTVQRLPVEVGVGRHAKLDSFLVHWFNWPQGSADLPVNCPEPILAVEAILQEGSCPFLYAWDGTGFRFVTDILGAAPLGLPVAEGRYIESDPEELVWVGTERTFPPRDGRYQVRLTEELREVLYLDEARLVVVDHAPGTEVHSTGKLLPSGPFPRATLMSLHRERRLQAATTLEGRDVTEALRAVDGRRVSPSRLRVPQLRGLAEPHGVVLDFGPLDAGRPWVLVLNGWLRFGGGMANIAASHDPALPFPFPRLEAESPDGVWETVDVFVGAPAGKTKTILVDLEGKLKPGSRRLRLTQAFEIHWDRVALLEKEGDAATSFHSLAPEVADLRFRGFSPMKELPADWPPEPDYDRVRRNSSWTIIPEGWSTRYGDVRELVLARDEGLALVHSGDELSLEFAADALPPKPAGQVREFFLHVDGWDKDSDFHVATGTTIEPLPFHGFDDQRYGLQSRPAFPSDALHTKYNTRWVEGRVLERAARR